MAGWGQGRWTCLAIVDATLSSGDNLFKEMNLFEQRFRQQPVNFLAIYEDATIDTEQMNQHAVDAQLAWLPLRDIEGAFTTGLQVERVPIFLLVDPNRRVVYRGPLGSMDLKQPGLSTALAEALDQKAISQPTLEVSGRPRTPTPERSIRYRTFTDHVAGVLESRCQSCHQVGGMAPFPLVSFQDAVLHADQIREVLSAGRMPPVQTDARYGQWRGGYSMSKTEVQNLLDWLDAGRSIGNESATFPSPKPVAWHIDSPTTVVSPNDWVLIPPGKGGRPFYVVVDEALTKDLFPEDLWVTQLEVKPSLASTVRHLQAYIFAPGVDPTPENTSRALATVTRTPDGRDFSFPDGTGLRLPARSRILFEMIVGPTSKPMSEKPTLGLVRATGAIESEIRMENIYSPTVAIEPNDAAAIDQQVRQLQQRAELWGVVPAMNLIGSEFRLSVEVPREDPEILLQLVRQDPAYRQAYWFSEPRALRSGTKLAVQGRWDHSRLGGYRLPAQQPVSKGAMPTGERLDAWLVFRLPKESSTVPTILTEVGDETLSAAMLVKPTDPLVSPPSLVPVSTIRSPGESGKAWWELAAVQAKAKEPRSCQVGTPSFSLQAGHQYVATFTASCDQRRRLPTSLVAWGNPFDLQSEERFFEVEPTPKRHRLMFLARQGLDQGSLQFHLGESTAVVRMENLQVEDFGPQPRGGVVTRNAREGTIIQFLEGIGEPMRVDVGQETAPDIWGDALSMLSSEVKEGTYYTISFRARADRVRRVNVSLTQDTPPQVAVGLTKEMIITRSWSRYSLSGSATKTVSASITFFHGGDPTDFELADLEIKALPATPVTNPEDESR
jgi:hypothetical protein